MRCENTYRKCKGGNAVYTARIMLGIEPFENGLSYRTSAPISTKKTILAFPNPASQVVTLRFTEVSENESAIIEILSLNGKLVRSMLVRSQSTELAVKLANLPDGIYLARIRYLSGEYANIKIVICQ